jgi:glycosyltransferase involved in cell wall biosynthesis
MTICYFGDYAPDYARTRILIKGLRIAGAKVIECNVLEGGTFSKLRTLYRKHRKIGEYDVMLVGQGDFRLMPLFARCITRKPIVWEPLFSLYDAWVYDRKLANPYSLKALLYWLIDRMGSMFTDTTLLDTKENAEYFIKEFRLPRKKLSYAYIGADKDVFTPKKRAKNTEIFEVEFHGKYIPVQGTDVLVRAAKILMDDPSIHFTMIGSGQEAKRTQTLAQEIGATNVTFLGFLPQSDIAEYIANADVCIGLIGDVPRVGRAIPNKLYEAAAMSRVSINADGPGIRELFTPGKDVVTIKQGDAEDLARAIRELKASGKASEMGKAAYETYLRTSTPEVIGRKLYKDFQERFGK